MLGSERVHHELFTTGGTEVPPGLLDRNLRYAKAIVDITTAQAIPKATDFGLKSILAGPIGSAMASTRPSATAKGSTRVRDFGIDDRFIADSSEASLSAG